MLCWSSQVGRRALRAVQGTPSPHTTRARPHSVEVLRVAVLAPAFTSRGTGHGPRRVVAMWPNGWSLWFRRGARTTQPWPVGQVVTRSGSAFCAVDVRDITRTPELDEQRVYAVDRDVDPRVAASSPSSSLPTPSRSSAMPTSRCHRPHCPSRVLPQHRSAECPMAFSVRAPPSGRA